MNLSDEELISRLRNPEDHFVERKSASDSKDWLKTVVAFANSVPVGYPAVLFIGAKNDGSIEAGADLDSLQRSFSVKMNSAFPRIYYLPKLLAVDSDRCLAVVVPGSALRPHFAGLSYVREGSITREASERQFQVMIAERTSKAYEVLKWKEKKVTIDFMRTGAHVESMGPVRHQMDAVISDCNQHFLMFRQGAAPGQAVPLSRVDLSYDFVNDRLKLEIRP